MSFKVKHALYMLNKLSFNHYNDYTDKDNL